MLQVSFSVSGSLLCICQINPVFYKLKLPSSLLIPNAFHVCFLKPLVLNHLSRKPVSPSAVSGPEDTYEIKEILEVKRSKGKLYYLID